MTYVRALAVRARPAFDKIVQGSVVTKTDTSMGMRRVEIMCVCHVAHTRSVAP